MKQLDDEKRIKAHAFVCTNNRDDGRDACQAFGGQEFHAKLKAKLKEAGIYSTHKATRSGCLGYCNNVGCTVTIYRQGKPASWFTEVTDKDFDRIWDEITKQ